eukprot:XP_025002175.1 nascent polypeptide-associated complex subunit alpha, muscle-specific form-like [Gallus gallus]
MAERIPRGALTVPLTPDAIFSEATVPPPDPAWMQPTIRGPMPVPPQALPVPTATYLAPQASVWPGVPGVWGQAARLPPGGLPPTGAPLPPGGLPPTGGLHLPVLQLLPGGLHPAMAPPTAPAHCWGHPLLAGTLPPQQPMGLWPGAVFHGEPPQPAGTCLPQAPGRPGPPPVLLQVPPLQEQVLPVPCTLPATWESPMEPFQDAVVLTEDQGHPAPTDGCPHPATAPLGCSTAALDSGAATASADIPEDVADIQHLLAWLNDEVTSKTGILYDDADIDDLLTWINNEETPSTHRLDNDDVEMDRLLTWIDEAALEVPQHKQDLPGVTREGTKATANSCQTQELMQRITATEPLSPDVSSSLDSSSSGTEHSDSSGASRELSNETHPESGLLSNSLCWQPASPELPVPTPLAAPAPPSPRTAHLMEEARRRQPRVVLTRLALPTPLAAPAPLLPRTARLIKRAAEAAPDMHHEDSTEPAKCPAPACTTTNSKSTGHEQHTGSGPATKRKLPRCHDGPGHKHRR